MTCLECPWLIKHLGMPRTVFSCSHPIGDGEYIPEEMLFDPSKCPLGRRCPQIKV